MAHTPQFHDPEFGEVTLTGNPDGSGMVTLQFSFGGKRQCVYLPGRLLRLIMEQTVRRELCDRLMSVIERELG